MSEYEVIELVLEFGKAVVENGQYIVTGLFAFVVLIRRQKIVEPAA